jgi:hypothetical protein
MNARWDLIIPTLVVFGYSGIMLAIGYYEGRRGEQERQLMLANANRVKMADAKLLYDWERDGI